MEDKIIYPEDVIEVALQLGMKEAQERFSLTYQEVRNIVKPFTDELDIIQHLCDCEIARQHGMMMMCFMCSANYRRL